MQLVNTVSMLDFRLLFIFLSLLLCLLMANKMRKMLFGALRDASLVGFLSFFLFGLASILFLHLPSEHLGVLIARLNQILVRYQGLMCSVGACLVGYLLYRIHRYSPVTMSTIKLSHTRCCVDCNERVRVAMPTRHHGSCTSYLST